MDDLTQQLIEELDAFRKDWRTQYLNLPAAVRAAGLDAMFVEWCETPAGKTYMAQFANVPDHVGIAKREMEAYRCPASLPYGYGNVGEAMKVVFGSGDE